MNGATMQVMARTGEIDRWTPQALFDQLNMEFNFDIDVCASYQNHLCPRYYTIEDDALKQKWSGVCWMNPPYGRQISAWMEKAYLSSLKGVTVVCLIPSRTDTEWFHKFAMKGELRFIKGRVSFIAGHKSHAPFPSAIVIFRSAKAK